MSEQKQIFSHLFDTGLSASFRFSTELFAWIAGPWAISLYSIWLVIPAVLILVGLPSIFSTPNDKNKIIIPTPGLWRVIIELFLYAVALLSPWLIWSNVFASLTSFIVIVSLVLGYSRFEWLVRGAPAASDRV